MLTETQLDTMERIMQQTGMLHRRYAEQLIRFAREVLQATPHLDTAPKPKRERRKKNEAMD
jgi:hypothetical protein